MKRLLVLRHAKSDWGEAVPDHERPLNDRGERAAARVGRAVAALGVPDRVVSSTAVRARTTAEIALAAGGWNVELETARELYEATPSGVLAFVRERGGEETSLLLVGHQPTWSELVGLLVAGPSGAWIKMPTAALARITLEIDDWSGLVPGVGRLDWLLTPKLLEPLGV